jgi:hypothetical protein
MEEVTLSGTDLTFLKPHVTLISADHDLLKRDVIKEIKTPAAVPMGKGLNPPGSF